MPNSVSPRHKKPKSSADTASERSARACARHLDDLEKAHGRPPPDVNLPSRSVVRLVSPVPEASWCTSPAQLCAELAE